MWTKLKLTILSNFDSTIELSYLFHTFALIVSNIFIEVSNEHGCFPKSLYPMSMSYGAYNLQFSEINNSILFLLLLFGTIDLVQLMDDESMAITVYHKFNKIWKQIFAIASHSLQSTDTYAICVCVCVYFNIN